MRPASFVRRRPLPLALVIILGAFCLGTQEARAQAITFDSSSSAAGPNVSTLTWAHTIGAGTNRVLYVGVSVRNGTVSGVTYAGQALALVGSWTDPSGKVDSEIWRLVAPPTGTANVVVTLPAAKRFVAGAVSFFNVDQTTPNGAFAGADGNNLTPTITVASAVNDVVLDVVSSVGDANSLTANAGQTQRYNNNTGNNGNESRGGASTKPGAASVTMSWTLGGGKDWAIGAISIHPVPPTILNISKTDAPDPVNAGSNITYTINYSNTGGSGATGVVITDTIPVNTSFVSATGGGTLAAGVVTWNIGALAAGASGSVQLVVAVASPLNNGTVITNGTYNIDSTQTAPTAGAAVTTTVSSAPVMNISKTDAPDPVNAGSNITYTINYSNTGNMNATGVVITDTIPVNTSFVSATGGGTLAAGVVTWNIGALAAGASGSVQLVVAVASPLNNGTVITNGTYDIDSTQTAPTAGAAVTTTVSSAPVMNISKTDAPDPVNAGSNITYTINYSNTGNMNATGVVITDTIPVNTSFVSATGGGTLAAGVVTWNIGALAAGASGSVQLVVAVASPLNNGTVITNGTYDIDSTQTAPTAGAAVTTTVSSAPVMNISKTDAPDPVNAGSNITYTINYSNTGNMNATGVVITDTIPVNTSFVSATGGGTLAAGVVTWNIGALAAGASGSVQLVVAVASPLNNGTVITNGTYNIDSTQTAPTAGAAVTTTVSSAPVMNISKTDAPDPVNAGSNITYTINYSNTGNMNATGVVITDTIPVNTSFVSATGGGTLAAGVVTWNIGALAAGASGSVQLVVAVASPLNNGTVITNGTYDIDSTQTAPTAGAAVTTTVSSAPVMNISKTDAPDPVNAGSNITYTINYSNTGNMNATGVVITDTIPVNTSFVSATGGGTLAAGVVTWNIGALAAGASGSVQLVVAVASPLNNGTVITNGTYDIDSTQTAPTAGAAVTTTVSSAPVMNISKTDAPDPVNAGSNITYTINYSNTGNMNATGVVITDTIPVNTSFVSATGGGTLAAGVVTWNIGALAAGASGSVQLVVAVASPLNNGTVITNGTYNIDSTQTAPTAGAAVTTTVSSAPVMNISKTDAPDPVNAGSNITYTINYSNTGNMNATGVVITDTIPVNTSFVSATGGGTLAAGVVTWNIGALAAGASGSVQLVVAVASPLNNGTVITNGTYDIDSTQTAPTAGAAVTTTVSSAPVMNISKTDAPDPVNAGSNITYTINYSNTGNMNATGVVITDTIPVNTSFVSATGGGTLAAGVVTWNIGALAAGASGSVQLVVAVASPLNNGTVITNGTYDIDSTQTAPTAGAAVTTTVSSAPVMNISKTDAPDPVNAGSNITYTINYSNTGNMNATGVVITDTIPVNTSFVSATGGGTLAAGVVTWNIGALAAGASGSVQLVVAVASPLNNGTVITNGTYNIDSTQTAPTAGAAVTTTVSSAPVMNISKTDAPDPVNAGSNITYTINYSNTGNMNATGVVITDTIPVNTSFVSATGGGTLAAGVVTWNIGALAAGASGSVQLVVAVASPLNNGTVITNGTYDIDSTQTAPTAGAAVTTTVSSAPVMNISKTDAPDPVNAGSNITYTINYSNTGNMNATGVVITDTIPVNTSFVSATGGGTLAAGVVTWNIGLVASGSSGSVQLVVQVTSPLADGTIITNGTYDIDSNETTPAGGTAVTTTVTSLPTLNISKADSPDPVAAGTNITYTLSYSNTGNANATGVVISDTVPVNTSFVSATGGGTLAAGVVTWNIGALAAGASGSVQLVVQVTSPLANGTIITNATYSIDSNQTAPTIGAAITTTVTSDPILTIGKTDSPDPAVAGADSITYTLSYSNIGTADATGVVIADNMPAGTSFVSATGGGTLAAGVVTWNIGPLAAGASGSVQMIVAINTPVANGAIITNAIYSIDCTETAAVNGAAVTTTVLSDPRFTLGKSDAPDPVAAGSNITYTLSYQNVGTNNATGVVISDTVPANTTFVSATGGGTLAAGVVTWNIGNVNSGASGSVQLVVQVASPLPNGTIITNTGWTIDSNESLPQTGPDATTTVTSAPVLAISKTDAPDPVVAGNNITYTLSYSNTGNANATGVVITDAVPTNTTFVSATGGGTLAAGVVTWNIGALAAGASGSVQLVVAVASPLANGTVISNATYQINSNETAPTAGAAITTTVSSAPVLAISKTDAPDPVNAGSNITYTLSYSNTGNADATGVVVSDTVPANTSFVSATGGGTLAAGVVTWNIGALAAGASGSVQLVVAVASPLANGTIITNSTYSIDSNETAPTSGAAITTTVSSVPVLVISKTDAPDPVNAGSNITYTLSYSNTGNADATGVVITDAVPTNTTFVSATGGGTLAAGVVTWNIGALAAGASGSVQLVVAVASPLANGTIITNSTYSIDSNETAPTAGAAITTTVSSVPVLVISKTDAPDPVNAGSNITYTLSYSNTGNADATGVVITDAVPTNTTFVSATGGGTLAAGVVTWNIGALAAGASGSVQLVVAVASPLANGTVISNATYQINSNETAPTAGAAITTTVSSAPVLAISKTDAPDPVNAGSNITYTLSYSNTGNADATGVVVSDTVPANTSFVSATGGGTLAAGVVTWNIGVLAAGASGSVQLVVAVASPLANGTIITNSTYSIDSNETAPTAGAAITTTVSSVPVLVISKTDAPDPVSAGSNITYTLSYSNTGNADATGVVVSDTVPANTSFVSATGGGTLAAGVVTWNIGALAAGASGSVQLVVAVASPLANGTIITNSTYSIDSNETAPTSGAAITTTVSSVPVLVISKTDAPDPVNAGSNITYTLSYSNTGNANATGVVVSDTVPANTSFVSATGGGTLAAGVVTWNIGALAAGASGSVQLVVAVASPLANGTIITNSTYSIDSNETAPTAGAAITTTVSSVPVLVISKTDAPDPVNAGSNITYTLSYSNTGNADATGVVITDAVPTNTTFVSATGGGTLAAGVVTWNIGALAAGASGSVQLVVAVASPLANGTVISNATYQINSNETAPTAGAAITTTVSSAPVLAISKTDAPDPVNAGSNITYTLSYSNTGNADATGVVVSDTVPANTSFVSATGGGTLAAGVVTWNIGVLAAGASGSVQLVVAVASPLANGTIITNSTYSIDSNETAPTAGAAITTTVSSVPVLVISKTDAPDPVNAGSNITYTLSYSNTGNANATGVVVSDTVPANTSFVSATGGGTLAAGVVTWNIGALAAGASGSVQLVVAVASPLANGTIITNSTYSIDSNETAPTAGAAITTTVSSAPVLVISKTDAPDPVNAGSNITYTLTYGNTGNADATGVVITDAVPTNTTFVSATGGGTLAAGVVTWNIGALATGASGSVQLVVAVASPLANGTIITNSTYSIDSNETAPASGAAITTTVSSAPVLAISKTDAPDPVNAGSNITYTLSYSNTGNADATGVVVSDTVPANTSFVSATGGGTLAAGVVTWNIGVLAAGASGSVQLVVAVASPLANGTIITNSTYSIDSNETAPTAGAAITTTVSSVPVLVISKTDAPDPVNAGSNITYTLSYSNTGNANATGVVVSDTVPANTSFVSATGGGTLAAGVVTWNIGALAAGASGSVQLVVAVASPLANGTIITNSTYSIDSNETAPTSGAAITTTVSSAPVLVISKTDAPDPVNAGSNITYTLTYGNTGNADATGVVITDAVPTNTTFVSATGGGTLAAGVVTWNIGALATGASGSVQLVVAVASPLANGTIITNSTYSIDSNETAPASGAAITTTVSSAPVLAISKTDAPDPVNAGSNITYTLSYSNTGNADATGVVVSDTVPANTSFVSATGGGTLAAGVVTWNIGVLAAGASGSVQLVVAVASPLANGTIITNSTYSIDSNETAPTAGAAITTTVSSVPVLVISKTDAPDPVNAGSNITYTLSYSNTGNANATGVVVSDTVPANTSFVSATGGGTLAAGVVTWNIGALAAGASGSVQLVVAVASPLANGTIITNSTYSIDSNETAPTSGAAITTTVSSAPVLVISKTDAPDPVNAGSNITYTLTYGNTGNADATGVVITDAVPTNTTFVSATGGGTLAAGVVTWNIGALAAGASGSVQVVVAVASPLANGTVISNATYQINSNETAPTAGAAITTTVSSAPVLAISKTDAPDPVNAGSNITYTLSYSNTGNANATGVVVSDTVPANTSFVSATGGGTLAAGVVTWNIGALATGASGSVQLVVRVSPAVPNGTIVTNGTYSIDSNETAPTAGAADTTAVVSAAVLSVTETVADLNGGSLNPGDTLEYTITVINSGGADGALVVVNDTVTAGTTYVPASITGTGADDSGNPNLTWNVGIVPALSSVTLTFRVNVDPSAPGGSTISNQASLSAAGPISLVSDDPGRSDVIEAGNDPFDPGDDDPTNAGPVFLGDVLQVSITSDTPVARRGDFILYTVTVANPTALPVASVDLSNLLPIGAQMVAGTLSLCNPVCAIQPDPTPAIPRLIPLGAIAAGQTITLSYRALVSTGALLGELVTTIRAQDAIAQPLSAPATSTVALLEDAEFDLGTVVGKVFDDKDGNGVQGAGETGVGGVMVAMEDGVYAVTDGNGMYHIAAVRPGNRLVKINVHTLPPNDGLTLPEAQTITLTPGLLLKVNFGARIKPPTTIRQGRPGTYGIAVTEEKLQAQAEVVGNLDDMTAVVNGVQARLPKTRVKMDVMSLERNLRIVNGRLEKPAVFNIAYPADRFVKEWVFEIFDSGMQRIRGFRGTDRKTTRITWDGKDATGALVKGGSIYQYQLTIEFADGSLSKSPLRMFGVNRTNAISFELTGASFETNTAILNQSAMGVLAEVTETLKKYPDEKVVVRGHTDSTGAPDWNARLSLMRAEAVKSYLVAAGIDGTRLISEGRGAESPVAPNSTPAGRARNRRVEIKALLEDTEVARTYAESGGSGDREVVVNGRTIPADEDGSFRTVVDPVKDKGRVYVGIKTEDGGVAATTVMLPTITILEPTTDVKLEIGKREDVIRLMQPKATAEGVRYPTIKIRVRGRTEPGNQVFLDGEAVAVGPSGEFKTDLPLAIGENTFGAVAVAPNGTTSLLNLAVNLSGVDKNLDLITVRKPVPQFSIDLPPRGAVLSSPTLFVRGTAPAKASVTINKWRMPVLPNGTFAGSVRLPEGPSVIDVVVSMPNSTEGRVGVPVEVRSNYVFLVALGDATISKVTTEGPIPDKFEDDLSVDGRAAFYLKGRIQGKYLITASMDTGDGRVSEIGSRLGERDNRAFFRDLDPDSFYPVYGDGSRTYDDTNSQGRFYVLLEAPYGSALWGNYNSGITGNEFSSFNRSLYGGRVAWKSLSRRKNGEPLGQAVVFAAVPETRPAHDEFTGTGGSLYFLRNKGVVEGSEKVRLEIRDKITGIPVANVTRRNYVDYEIDYAEGRVLFRAPVSSVADASTIISDGILNGNPVFVIVDYEYTDVAGAAMDVNTYGGRAKAALGENVSVGATYIQEERPAGTYSLEGGDVTVRISDSTRVTAEFSQSQDEALAQYVSTDGGLSFGQKIVPFGAKKAQGYKLEVATGKGPVKGTAYLRHLDRGFSSSFTVAQDESDQAGVTLGFALGKTGALSLLVDNKDVTGVATILTSTLQYRQSFGKFGATLEARYRTTDNVATPDMGEGIGALRLDYRPTAKLDFYTRFQDDFLQEIGGSPATTGVKRQTAIGLDAQVSPKVNVKGELIDGEQGDGVLLGLTTRVDERTQLYGTYTLSPDHAGVMTGTLTAGAVTALGDRTRLYSEEQFKNSDREISTSTVVGLNTQLSERFTTGVNLERTRVDGAPSGPDTIRQAASVHASFAHALIKMFSKFELRHDEAPSPGLPAPATDRDQWLAGTAVELKLSRDFTLLGRFNYGVTTDNLTDTDVTVFREQSAGVAFRPVSYDWIQVLARYTEVRNLPPAVQVAVPEEKTDRVLSLQTVVDLHRRVSLTEKYAIRDRRIDQSVVADLKSRLSLWINRFNYHLSDTWDAALEYRTLTMDEGADNASDGFLFEVNRLFFGHLRLGVGYNFTDFTDNEFSANDYSAKGYFFRVQGKY